MKRYILYPGPVRSQTDGQVHYVGAADLAQLYGVRLSECVVMASGCLEIPQGVVLSGARHLRPRADGQYQQQAAEQGGDDVPQQD